MKSYQSYVEQSTECAYHQLLSISLPLLKDFFNIERSSSLLCHLIDASQRDTQVRPLLVDARNDGTLLGSNSFPHVRKLPSIIEAIVMLGIS